MAALAFDGIIQIYYVKNQALVAWRELDHTWRGRFEPSIDQTQVWKIAWSREDLRTLGFKPPLLVHGFGSLYYGNFGHLALRAIWIFILSSNTPSPPLVIKVTLSLALQEIVMEEGYRFHPTDSELLAFLLRFIAEKDLRDDGYITEHDVYKQEPWVTYGCGCHCGGEDDGDTSSYRYFITPMHKNKIKKKKKSLGDDKKKDRFCRIVGEKLGTWKQKDKGKNVIMTSFGNQSKSLIIGRKKSLCYETTRCCPDDGKWLMKEYAFCEIILNQFSKSKFRDYVICAIKRKSQKNSSNGTRCSNRTTIMDTEVDSEVNSVEPLMDLKYNALTPIQVDSMLESEVQIQGAASEENNVVLGITTTTQIQEHNDLEIMDISDQDFEMISPISVAENLMLEFDEFKAKIQEADGEENGVWGIQEFENASPEINLPNFLDLLSGDADYCSTSNHVEIQEAHGEENGQLELCTSPQIQEPVILDFANLNSQLNMPDFFDTCLNTWVSQNSWIYELISPFDFSKQGTAESNASGADSRG
ncbi:hypothetical protein BC332_00890 [Capsicum chinense]|nr:hypothetical protein BC332_00890 [Capsicum chinense]